MSPGPPNAADKTGRALGKLLLWAVVIVVGLFLLDNWITPEQEQLARQYHVSKEHVIVAAEPHGCAYNDAPLGYKHCRFDKIVDLDRACPGPDCKVTGVYVSWRKVEE